MSDFNFMQGLFGLSCVVVIFGVWDILKILRNIQGDLRLLRIARCGTAKPEGWE